MASPTIIYDSREMLAAMEQTPPRTTFLQDLFIGDRLYTDKTELEIDTDEGTMTVSPFVSRNGAPTPVGKKGYDTKIHAAPYIYDEITFSPSDGDQRLPGNTIYGNSTMANVDRRTADWMKTLMLRAIGAEELQVATALQTGELAVSGVDVDYTVDYGRPVGHTITLTGANVWGTGTEDKIGQIESWSQTIMDTGAPAPNVMVCDLNSAQLLKKDSNFISMLDKRNVRVGEIDIKLINGQRASYIGTMLGAGVNIDVYCYQGFYVNAAGSTVRYMGDDNLILGSTEARFDFHYTKIENFNSTFIGRWFPMMGIDDKGKNGYLSLESGPLAGMHQPKAYICVNVK